MPTDKTPEDQVHQLDEAQLDEAAGGLLPAVRGLAVDPSDPSGATVGVFDPSRGTFYLRNTNTPG